MGSQCLKIPISSNDINFFNCHQEQNKEVHELFYEQKKQSDPSEYSDQEIQQTSHSDEDISLEYLQTRQKMITQSPNKPTKSILKTQSQYTEVRRGIKNKTVSFCFTDPTQLKQMLNHKGKLSKAQEEFLQSLYSSNPLN